MLLLATDTSGREGTVALALGEKEGTCRLIGTASLSGGSFSAQLVLQIRALLSSHGFNKTDIGGFVVVSGPGSFTGLRVGLAAIKALAEVLAKPIAVVSSLEAIAISAGLAGRVMAAMDAGRQQIYLGEYNIFRGNARSIKESVLTRDDFADTVRLAKVVTPDSAIALLAQTAGAEVQVVTTAVLELIAQIGWTKILSHETVLAENLEANYISRSNVEIFPKSGS